MKEPLELYGYDGLNFIVQNATMTFDNTASIEIEKGFIQGCQKWVEYLKDNGHYDGTVNVDFWSVYAKEKATTHGGVIEVQEGKTVTEGFGQNEMPLFWHDGTDVKEYTVKAGSFPYNITITLRSTERSSCAHLTDVVKIGLETNIDNYLAGLGINIPASSITQSKPRQMKRGKDASWWEQDIKISEVLVHWRQIYETSGEPLRNFGYYISRLNQT